MKKVILTVAAIFAFGFANAQDTKEATGEGFAAGDVFMTGSVGFMSSKTGDFKATGFDFSPKAAYFVTENMAIGVALGLENTKLDNGSSDAKNNTMSIGAFARYYGTPASKFSFFGQLGVNYNNYKNEFDPTDGSPYLTTQEGNGFDIMLSPGVSYFMSNNFALEATIGSLGYETTKPDATGAESTDTFGLNFDLSSIKLGLVYKF